MRRITLAENSPLTTAVFTVRAQAGATFSLTGPDAQWFDISSTGVVTLKAAADYEARSGYKFSIEVMQGNRVTTTDLLLSIRNINDTAPVFVSPATGSVVENTPAATTLYVASAFDADGLQKLAYGLSGTDAALLRMSRDGTVTLRSPADYESRTGYSFDVTVTDGVHSATRHVDIAVVNVNDNAPAITSPSTGEFKDDVTVSMPVYSAAATDADGDTVTWSLGGTDAPLLDIAANGDVTLKAPAQQDSYDFTVTAGDGVHNTTKAVHLAVTDGPAHVGTVTLSGDASAAGSVLRAGDKVTVTVSLTKAVDVTGTPQVALQVGADTVKADYASGSGSGTLTFEYTIQPGQNDADGISIDADSLSLNGGTISSAAGAAVITHAAVADDAALLVDTTAPAVSIAISSALVAPGQSATVTFSFTEDPGASFTGDDIAAAGGTLGELSGTGLTRTATFTASDSSSLNTGGSVSVAAGSFTDAAGNASAAAGRADIATISNKVLFVGNSATFARVDPVMGYNTYDAATNPGGVHDLTSPDRGGTFTNLTGSNLDEAHNWGGVPGLVDKFAEEAGLNWDVSISARNAATLKGQYLNSSPAGWDMRGNIAGDDWDIVVLQDQTDEPLPGGSGSITFAAGSSTASLIVTPTGDTAKEYDETLSLTLASSANYRVGTSGAVSTTILNDDPNPPATNPLLPTVSLVASPGAVAEDGTNNLVYTFTRTGATTSDLVVTFTVFRDGSTNPSVSTTVSSSQDLELYNTTTGALSTAGGSGTSPYRFTNGGGFATSSNTGVNTTTGSVSFTSNTGTITIKAGQASASITMDPHADVTVENDENIRITLTHPASGQDYNIGTAGPIYTTIVNDDFSSPGSLPNVTLSLGSATSVYESDGQNLVYTFTRSGDTSSALTVNFTEDGTATYFAGDPSHSDFGISTSGAAQASLTTTSGKNADIASFGTYANLIEDYIHTGAADTATTPGTTIPANANADAQTDIYLYATWARPDMVAGAADMLTDRTVITSGPDAGANGGTGAITNSGVQAPAYYLSLEDMTQDLQDAYANLAATNSDFKGVAPVGEAFLAAVQGGYAIRDPYTETSTSSVSTGEVNLWFDDNLHASKYGSYLAGLVLFETLSGLDAQVLGAGDEAAQAIGIDAATAVALQRVASATAGFDQSLHWSAPGCVSDLGGSNASVTLATAGAFTFGDDAYSQHSVSVQGADGNLGTLTAQVRSDGHSGQVNWLYTVDNAALDSTLATGEEREEQFTVTLDDGHGHVSVRVIGVILAGS